MKSNSMISTLAFLALSTLPALAQEAVELYKQANELGGGKCPECVAGMATAFNQMGAFKQAADSAQKLVDLNASKDMTCAATGSSPSPT